jgi:uncharacterized membrane protein YGL010W
VYAVHAITSEEVPVSIHRLDHLFDDYRAYHQTRGNKLMHRIGIPMIVFSLLGMLAQVVILDTPAWPIDLGLLLIVLAALFYFTLDAPLALAMTAVSLAFYFAARVLPLPVNIALFILGWIVQFVGHGVYEKRQPAFARNLIHLLVGPLWILDDAMGRSARRRPS